MKSKAKISIIIGCFIIIIVGSGIYLNNKMGHLLQQSGSLWLGQEVISDIDTNPSAEQESEITEGSEKTGAKADGQSGASSNNSRLELSGADNKNVVTHLQEKVDQPIEKIDLLKVSIIAVRKLSTEDISYLSKIALQNSYSQEDYQRSREILTKKLSADDINTLKKIGEKYGKDINI